MKIQAKYLILLKKNLSFIKQQKGKRFSLDLAKVSDPKLNNRNHIKILTPKQMLQRLPIALAEVKTSSTSENLLNEVRQIRHSLYQAKEITKKVYII